MGHALLPPCRPALLPLIASHAHSPAEVETIGKPHRTHHECYLRLHFLPLKRLAKSGRISR